MLEIQLLKERLKLRTLKEEKSNLYPQGYSEAKPAMIVWTGLSDISRHFPSIALIKLAFSGGSFMFMLDGSYTIKLNLYQAAWT